RLLAPPARSLTSTLFPYTTLFRSPPRARNPLGRRPLGKERRLMTTSFIDGVAVECEGSGETVLLIHGLGGTSNTWTALGATLARSEEHTSELQSRENLVCRLLLEK